VATLNLQVAASADDATEDTDTSVNLTGERVYLDVQNRWGGVRLNNVTVPPGATINTATLQFYVTSTNYDNVHITVFGDDADEVRFCLAMPYQQENLEEFLAGTDPNVNNDLIFKDGFESS